MEQDRERLCGPKNVPDPDRRAYCGGSVRGEVTLGGRRIRVPRLRARSVDGHELDLPSFAYAVAALAVAVTWWPYSRLDSEFMPPLYEGDLLYMPMTLPGMSITKARELLQQTGRITERFPEVHHVFGKSDCAETATDPAPLSMVETTIMLKPEEDWPVGDITDMRGTVIARRRRTPDELVDVINAAVPFPGVTNAWTNADQDAHQHALHRDQDAGRHRNRDFKRPFSSRGRVLLGSRAVKHASPRPGIEAFSGPSSARGAMFRSVGAFWRLGRARANREGRLRGLGWDQGSVLDQTS